MPTRRTFDKAEFLPNDNSTPHIVPDVLYPAIGGKLLDGTTSHSGDYGTAQSSDNRKYYYTDIKGSRPIRDPRIGAHFGSQRHKIKSLQLLEQETATQGNDVYSLDGREWLRLNATVAPLDFNRADGRMIGTGASGGVNSYFEIVGYFSDMNLVGFTLDNARGFNVKVDGGTATSENTSLEPNIESPLGTASTGRYVDAGALVNLNLSQTLGIHTVRVTPHASGDYVILYGIELIAQDTTNAVTRNKIQIPSQTVFSFGSKFTVGGSSAVRHYDPFSAKSDGTGWTSPTSGTNTPNSSAAWPSNIDTATSLGLAKWVDGTNYYRPYNGGRVVNWVDENGEIKTSVTVMPPNAKSIGDSGTLSNGTAKSNGSAPNDNFRPTFEAHTSSVDEDLLSEVAKTFHFREFGNGSANGNANYLDPTTLTSSNSSDRAYVMDDGLTSFSGDDANVNATHGLWLDKDNGSAFITFIGTGVSWDSGANGKNTWAQNLPYGTHVVQYYSGNQQSTAYYAIDGVQVKSGFDNSGGNYVYNWGFGGASGDITFHQPKMPPIPEGACIIADYMLMADFVPATSIDGSISKGVRYCNGGRDIFYDSGGTITYNGGYQYLGYQITSLYNNNATSEARFTAFGTAYACHYVRGTNREANLQARLDGANYTYVEGDVFDTSGEWDDSNDDGTLTKDGGSEAFHLFGIKNQTLGIHTFGDKKSSGTEYNAWSAFDVATPIHTSHHYKSFETPFLHELIGGDRNMEQTHLICSADGKTWDEVTRDTSYLSNVCIVASRDGGDFTSGQTYLYDLFRGLFHVHEGTQKNFAIGYDRFICLVGGYYKVTTNNYTADADRQIHVMKNSVGDDNSKAIAFGRSDPADNTIALSGNVHLKRGDYIGVYVSGGTIRGNNVVYTFISIEKLDK